MLLTLREYAPDLIGLGATAGPRLSFSVVSSSVEWAGTRRSISSAARVVMTRPELVADLTDGSRVLDQPPVSGPAAGRTHDCATHQLLARQPVLVALTRAFIDDGRFLGAGIGPSRSDVSALMLSHAVAAGLSSEDVARGTHHRRSS